MQIEHTISAQEISDLVDRFYAKVLQDPLIGPIFNAAVDDWPAHLALLKDFWSTVLLTSRRYQGDPLAKHLNLSLEPPHFARWLALFSETAMEVMPAAHAHIVIRKSQRIAENFRHAIAFQRDRDAPPGGPP
jgi:hemoglobin